MKITGDATPARPRRAGLGRAARPAPSWSRTIPGCERLEATGENAYAMTVTAGVAAIKGTYAGSCALSDLERARVAGDEAPGRRRARAPSTRPCTSRFAEPATAARPVAYDADAVVGGMVGGVGQRMLDSVSKRMAGEFFGNVASAIARRRPSAAADGAAGRRDAAARSSPRRRPPRGLAAGLPQGHRRRRRPACSASPGRLRSGGDRRSAPAWCSLGVGRRRRLLGRRRRVTDERPDASTRPPATMAAAVRRREISRARAARPAPGPDRRAQPRSSTRSSRLDEERARAGAAAADAGAGRGRRASGRCTGCRSRSRTPTTSPAGGRRTARRCSPTTSPTPTTSSSSGSARAGAVVDRQDQRAGVRGRVAHVQHGLRHHPQPGRPDPVRRRLERGSGVRAARPGWCRSPTAPTWAARCATPRRSAAWSGCARRWAGCRRGRPTTCGRPPRSAARWRATSATSRCCCRCIAGPDPRVPHGARRPGRGVRPAASPATLAGLRVALSPPTSAALFEVDARGRRASSSAAGAGLRGRRRARSSRRTPTSPRPTTPSAPCAPGTSRPASASCSPRTPTRSSSRWPTTSAPARRSPAPTSPAPTRSAPRWPSGCARSSSRTTCWCCRPRRCRRSRPTRSTPPTINGRPMATYLDWMRSAYVITVTGCPAISVPAGTHRRRAAGRRPDRRAVRRRPAAARGRGGLRARPRRR